MTKVTWFCHKYSTVKNIQKIFTLIISSNGLITYFLSLWLSHAMLSGIIKIVQIIEYQCLYSKFFFFWWLFWFAFFVCLLIFFLIWLSRSGNRPLYNFCSDTSSCNYSRTSIPSLYNCQLLAAKKKNVLWNCHKGKLHPKAELEY